MSRHLPILTALKGLVLGDQDAALLVEDALVLDGLQAWVASVEETIFPDTTPDPSLWEALLGLSSSGTLAERRVRILVALQTIGGLSKAHFISLASGLGYGIEITTCSRLFRAGLSAAGDSVIDPNPGRVSDPPGWDIAVQGSYAPVLWTWTVTVKSMGSNANDALLKSVFEAAKPAYSTILWAAGSGGTGTGGSSTTGGISSIGTGDVSGWTASAGGLAFDASVTSDGDGSMALLADGGYILLKSPYFLTSAFAKYSSALAYDIFIPSIPGNPNWVGDTQLYVDCQSAGVYSDYIGIALLQPLVLGAWNTVTFVLPAEVIAAIQGNHSDFQFWIVVNTPSGANDHYRIDNLRFLSPLTSRS